MVGGEPGYGTTSLGRAVSTDGLAVPSPRLQLHGGTAKGFASSVGDLRPPPDGEYLLTLDDPNDKPVYAKIHRPISGGPLRLIHPDNVNANVPNIIISQNGTGESNDYDDDNDGLVIEDVATGKIQGDKKGKGISTKIKDKFNPNRHLIPSKKK